jgi:hypothetical protein
MSLKIEKPRITIMPSRMMLSIYIFEKMISPTRDSALLCFSFLMVLNGRITPIARMLMDDPLGFCEPEELILTNTYG